MLDGVACLEGVDTLLLLLLADLGAARQVAAFAAVPNRVHVAAVEPRLQVREIDGRASRQGRGWLAVRDAVWLGRGSALVCQSTHPLAQLPSPVPHTAPQAEQWHHALATLHAARGEADVALRIWRQVADGRLASPAGPAVQAAERREALESAAALLRDPATCPESALVGYLPWLLEASQPAALGVLTARSLMPAAVLPLLPPESDVRWQYLAHVVEAGGPGAGPALHTELATQLAAAILRAQPALRAAAPPGSGPSPRRRARADAGRSSAAGRRASRASVAELVSGGSLEPGPGAGAVDAMRLRLRAHLERSAALDGEAVLRSLLGTALHEELVVLHAKASPLASRPPPPPGSSRLACLGGRPAAGAACNGVLLVPARRRAPRMLRPPPLAPWA